MGGSCKAADCGSEEPGGPGRSCLCNLHVWIDRQAEGRLPAAPLPGKFAVLAIREFLGRRRRQNSAIYIVEFRRFVPGDFFYVGERWIARIGLGIDSTGRPCAVAVSERSCDHPSVSAVRGI